MQTIPIWRLGVNVLQQLETPQSFNDLAI
jgi:hypothetical protein